MNKINPNADTTLWTSIVDWYQTKIQNVTIPDGFVQSAVDKFNQVKDNFTSYSFDPQPIQLKRLDPTIRENALRILNLTEEEATIPENVDQKYQFLTETLNKKKNIAGPIIARCLGELLEDVDAAYKTLTKV